MKKKLLFSAIALAIIFALAYRFSQKNVTPAPTPAKTPVDVTVQAAKDSSELKQKLSYPATVVGDQEVSVTAGSAGTAMTVPFNLGDRVSTGALLARIDNTGNAMQTTYQNFQSSQVQQSQLSAEQAKEALSAAKKNYKDLKKAHDSSNNTSVTKAQVDAADKQINIAQLQLDSATVGLQGTLDNHLVTSPITGYVTEKLVSVGDAVSVGQHIATISATKQVKLQFFVDQDHLAYFAPGLTINVLSSDGTTSSATVRNISPVADPTTRRFLIEAFPDAANAISLASGTLATISLGITQRPSVAGDLILPLSAVTIGQNENYIFINNDGVARKKDVALGTVIGESAEIKTDLSPDTQIILNGSKLVSDGSMINVQK